MLCAQNQRGSRRRRSAVEQLEQRALLASVTDGPLVGGVTDTSAKVFVRTDVPAFVRVEYSTQPDLSSAQESPGLKTTAAADDTAILTLSGLQPLTKYYYRFEVGAIPQQTSNYPSFTTFPPAGAPTDFTFDVFSDLATVTKYPTRPAPAYASGMQDNPAFVLQTGDFDHRNPSTLAQMRLMDRQVRSLQFPAGADFTNNVADHVPVDHVYDDHDYGWNNGGKSFPGRSSAIEAYREYYPTYTLPNPTAGIWHSFSYGQVDVFMMDLRSQRDVNSQPDGPDKSMLDGDNIVNGEKAWIENALLTSTATWKFVISTVPFNATTKTEGQDSWAGFQTERAELLNFIKQHNIQGVIFISGDLHSGGGIDDGTYSGLPEVSVPATNLGNGDTGAPGDWSQGILSGVDAPGFVSIQVLTNPDRVIIETRGEDGSVRLRWEDDAGTPPAPGPATWSVIAQTPANTGPAITATIHSATAAPVAGAEYFLDQPGTPGTGTPLRPQDGRFDSATETAIGAVDPATFAALAPAEHVVFVHGLDTDGNWGPWAVASFTKDTTPPNAVGLTVNPNAASGSCTIRARIIDPQPEPSCIEAAEYFLDQPGTSGTGYPMTAMYNSFNNVTEYVTATMDSTTFAGLAPGTHTVFVHGLDAAGNWGPLSSLAFTKPAPSGQARIDPGVLLGGLAVGDGTIATYHYGNAGELPRAPVLPFRWRSPVIQGSLEPDRIGTSVVA
jgi:alkaline phosphatase D